MFGCKPLNMCFLPETDFASFFSLFSFFMQKHVNPYFDQCLECTAPKSWSKYTTDSIAYQLSVCSNMQVTLSYTLLHASTKKTKEKGILCIECIEFLVCVCVCVCVCYNLEESRPCFFVTCHMAKWSENVGIGLEYFVRKYVLNLSSVNPIEIVVNPLQGKLQNILN